MNNTLTAKQWLEKELFADHHSIESRNPFKEDVEVSELMEKYAIYRTKMLEAKILEFRNLFKDINMIKRIDKHFNIKKMQGKINE